MRKFLDKFSLYWDFTNGAGSLGKAHPVKPVVRDLQGDFASVVRNSPKNLTQKTGLIGSIPANTIPYRWDGNRFGAFVEPSATNLVANSNDLTNGWTVVAGITPSTATHPQLGSCSRLVESTNNETHRIRLNNTLFTDGVAGRNISIYVVPEVGVRYVVLSTNEGGGITGSSGGRFYACFDLQTITVTETNVAGTIASILKFGDVYELYVHQPTPSDGNNGRRYNIWFSETGTGINDTSLSYTGTGRSMIVSFANGWHSTTVATISPILTTGSAQTRNADVITLSNIPDLIGQTQGFIYAEVNTRNLGTTANPRRAFSIEGSTDTNSAMLNVTTAGALETVFGGVTRSVGTTSANNGLQKWCILYYNGGFKTFRNGVLVDTYVGAWTNPSWDRFAVGRSVATASREFNDTIYRVGIGKEILSDEEAIFMTTL
jgi:hypothetical protein